MVSIFRHILHLFCSWDGHSCWMERRNQLWGSYVPTAGVPTGAYTECSNVQVSAAAAVINSQTSAAALWYMWGVVFFSKNFGTKVVVAQSSDISWSTLELGKVWRKASKFPLLCCGNELQAPHTPCSVVYMTIIAAWRFTECDTLFELLHHMCNPVRRRGNDVAIYNKRLRNKYVILSWQSPWPWCQAPWAKHRSLREWYIFCLQSLPYVRSSLQRLWRHLLLRHRWCFSIMSKLYTTTYTARSNWPMFTGRYSIS